MSTCDPESKGSVVAFVGYILAAAYLWLLSRCKRRKYNGSTQQN